MKELKTVEPDIAAVERAREARLRRLARKQYLVLRKSRRESPEGYMLVDLYTNAMVHGDLGTGFGCSLQEIETELARLAKEEAR